MSQYQTVWHAVQTKPGQEDRAALNLLRQGYGVYLPKYTRLRRHARKVERVARPLFKGYLFIAISDDRKGWRAINSTFGVARVVTSAGVPITVPEMIIDNLRTREDQDGCIRLQPQRHLKRGDKVRVTDGVFESLFGLYEGMKDSDRALVLVELLGRKVRALIDPEALVAD